MGGGSYAPDKTTSARPTYLLIVIAVKGYLSPFPEEAAARVSGTGHLFGFLTTLNVIGDQRMG